MVGRQRRDPSLLRDSCRGRARVVRLRVDPAAGALRAGAGGGTEALAPRLLEALSRCALVAGGRLGVRGESCRGLTLGRARFLARDFRPAPRRAPRDETVRREHVAKKTIVFADEPTGALDSHHRPQAARHCSYLPSTSTPDPTLWPSGSLALEADDRAAHRRLDRPSFAGATVADSATGTLAGELGLVQQAPGKAQSGEILARRDAQVRSAAAPTTARSPAASVDSGTASSTAAKRASGRSRQTAGRAHAAIRRRRGTARPRRFGRRRSSARGSA